MDCSTPVYSNDYYDFISDAIIRGRLYAEYPEDVCTQPLDAGYEVIYYPREMLGDFHITNFSYWSIPKCYTLMDTSALEASGILTMQNFPTLPLKGNGVLIGFLDTGIDYTNPIFQGEDGNTRIVRIWDQEERSNTSPEGFLYGSEYTADEINRALRTENPYQSVPSRDTNGHGTFLAGIAAGSEDAANQFVGAAPLADIAVVKLKEAKPYLREFFYIREGAVAYQENDIMAGISYLHNLAYDLSKPLVLCVGLGSNNGGHGGFAALPSLLSYVGTRRMRAVNIAAGNEANARHHYIGNLGSPSDKDEVEINVSEDMEGFVIELWTNIPERVAVSIQSPTGESTQRLINREGKREEYQFLLEGTKVEVDYGLLGTTGGNHLIFMRFSKPTKGIWKVTVYPEYYVLGKFHMWLPVSEFLSAPVFFLRSNPQTTITVPSGTVPPITVGGYNAMDNSLYLDSGRGFNINEQVKPDFLAPAVNVYGPGLRQDYVRVTGTSAATAITAGACAQLMEWGVTRGNSRGLMNSPEIKNMLIQGCEKDPNRFYPNPEEGYGRMNLYRTFLNMRRIT